MAEALRLSESHVRRRDERARRRDAEREAAEIDELRRVDAWLDRPGWLKYWDDDAHDFKVPEGWPPDAERAPEPTAEPTAEATPDTLMHRMLRERLGQR